VPSEKHRQLDKSRAIRCRKKANTNAQMNTQTDRDFMSYDFRAASQLLTKLGLFCVGLLLSGCSSSSNDQAANDSDLDKVTLMLNWFPEAEHGGFYAADVHGIFEEYGLDVEIRPGGPTAPVAQELVSGRVEFAIGNADDVLVFREQEVPVQALMAPIQNTPRCILVHASSSATSLNELAGLKMQSGSGRPYLEFMKSKGLLNDVQLVPYSGVPNFAADPQSAMQAYSFSEPLLAKDEGIEIRMMMVSEIGFNPYASCLIATDSYIAENEDLVRRMVLASCEGWQKYFEDPKETNAAILQANQHGMTMAALEFGVEELRGLCITSDTPADEMGKMTEERWKTLYDQFVEVGLLSSENVSLGEVFTTKYFQPAVAGE
jgi:NitT/TauT family transport system substrate-binding protein